jgi:hypothetical protein
LLLAAPFHWVQDQILHYVLVGGLDLMKNICFNLKL